MPTEAPIEERALGIPEVMTEDVLCALLSISPATAWRLREAKKLSYCKVGLKIWYLRRHVVAFLDSIEVVNSTGATEQERGETRLRIAR